MFVSASKSVWYRLETHAAACARVRGGAEANEETQYLGSLRNLRALRALCLHLVLTHLAMPTTDVVKAGQSSSLALAIYRKGP